MRKTVSRLILLGVAATLLLLAQPVSSQDNIPIADLGPSDGEGQPYEVNNQGQVVGSHEPLAIGDAHFLWSAEDGWVDLPKRGFRYAYVNELSQVTTSVYIGGDSQKPIPILWDGGEETTLGHLGTENALPRDINEKGEVAGYGRTANGEVHAFLWTPVGGMQDLGTLGGHTSNAVAMNDSPWVVGDSLTADLDNHAFMWTAAADGMRDLGTLGGDSSWVYDVNTLGQVVGCSSTTAGDDHAFLWTAESGMIDLGTLGGSYSAAFDISESGQVVGWSDTSGEEKHAFLWTAGDGMQDLGALSGGESRASRVSRSGQVIGYSYLATGEKRAFFWTLASGMVDLGTLPGGRKSDAVDINDHGQVVGWSNTPTGDRHAVLWTVSPQRQMMDMIGEIEGLVDDGLLKTGKANALVGKLENAIRLLDDGKTSPTCHQLEAFVNQVDAFTKTGQLPEETGLLLLDAADSVIGLICE